MVLHAAFARFLCRNDDDINALERVGHVVVEPFVPATTVTSVVRPEKIACPWRVDEVRTRQTYRVCHLIDDGVVRIDLQESLVHREAECVPLVVYQVLAWVQTCPRLQHPT